MEIKRDGYLNQLVNARQNGFIIVVTLLSRLRDLLFPRLMSDTFEVNV